ncbi:MAG: hypothetical protein UY44_C0001G0007 [Candidatus Kaiserbacteria bacterium GW2011_GWA2_49_19]|uniref:Uncharacterized protein n=1 Tax=Candidatus Kaiserbacteria bacterium GW2011_GWA2_49_19 TaxID=1618669 RepID=A0A0G1Y3H4_9BACT|nr:MAG: hypothetical protein UY44_C0001G0007 [Candidatus Kaiserbacteria bacterium GW2011_GWA2_49_19]
MSVDSVVIVGWLFHHGEGVESELANLRAAGATDEEIVRRFIELYPECRSCVNISIRQSHSRRLKDRLESLS